MLKSFFNWIFGEKPQAERPATDKAEFPQLVKPAAKRESSWIEGQAEVSKEKTGAPEFSRIGISYEDGEGNLSDRIISVAQLRVADGTGNHSTVVAFCHAAKAIRTFRVDRIKGFFDPETGEVLKQATLNADPSVFRLASAVPVRSSSIRSLADLQAEYAPQLEQMGWIVVREDFELGERVACYRMAKRGNKRLKYPSLEISYQEFHLEHVLMPDGTMSQRKSDRRKRPWCVNADSATTRTFGSIEAALPAFLDAARSEAEKQGLKP